MAGPTQREPQEPPASGLADPTRDIRLPPLPGRPPPVVPPEWEGAVPERASESGPEEVTAERPTDELGAPSASSADRDPTLTFTGSPRERRAAGHAATSDPAWSSVPPGAGPVVVAANRRARRWPWIAVALVPVLVIVVTGVWLLLLMR